KSDNTTSPITIEVKDTDACPRYVGICIEGIEVKPSPEWLQKRLVSIGLKPINNIVDTTNFVLHELGQPLHAFDSDKIAGNKVIVGQLPEKTKFKTLDGNERQLSDKDLMICNEKEGMCIAGIFGGLESGVSENTKNIFLESAYFNPVSIRKTAKRHGLNTDASFRFERGIDPEITVFAAKRAAIIIKEISGGKITSDILESYPTKLNGFNVSFSYSHCDRLIGKAIDHNLIKSILTDLQIEIKSETEKGLELYVPAFKVDVKREADVIEEVLRVYGYNEIELPQKMHISLTPSLKPQPEQTRNAALNFLANNGLNEIMSNSLTKAGYYPEGLSAAVEILNPLSKDLEVMRQSMLFSGLETVAYNQNRNEADLKLFEFGKTYQQYSDGTKEEQHISVFLTGNKTSENWNSDFENQN
ncbi:MAG: phenylalanine--tRNA ligase subunit beta, partial [Flavobacteriales bacterium]